MSKSSSTKFFGAAGVYNNFNSTAFAQQLTDTLSGNTPTQQAQVSSSNVVDVAAEQAGQQIDALAQATKAGLTRQINTVATAAGNSTSKPSPTIVTTATLTATTTATPPAGGDTASAAQTATGATTGAATGDSTAAATTETPATPAATKTTQNQLQPATDAAIDSGKFDVPGSDDDLKAAAAKPTVTPAPLIVVPPVVAAAPSEYSTSTYILITIAALFALLFISLVAYMFYTKKSASESFEAFKENLSKVFGKAPTQSTLEQTK